jgi:hypothetical protein
MWAIPPHMSTAATQLTQITLCEAIYRNANSPKPTAQLQSRAGKNKWNCTIHLNEPIHATYETFYDDRSLPCRRVGNNERNSGYCLRTGWNVQYSCHEASGNCAQRLCIVTFQPAQQCLASCPDGAHDHILFCYWLHILGSGASAGTRRGLCHW